MDRPGASLFKLEKIPDSYWCRHEELEDAKSYGYVDDLYSTKLLKDALEKEAEEIILLPKNVPGVLYHEGISPPPQGGSLRIFDVALDNRGMYYLAADGPPSVSILSKSGAWTGIKVQPPWGANMSSVASDEAGQVFALIGGKLVRVFPNGMRDDTVGTVKGRTGRFLVHAKGIFLIENTPDYADPNPPRAIPIIYHYDFGEKLICQSKSEPDFIFRELAMSADRESILVVAGDSPFLNFKGPDCGSLMIRYDLACQKLFSCRLPNVGCDYPAMSIASLPKGGFVAATEDRFSVYSDECALMFEETIAGRDMGRVSISRVRTDASGESIYFVDRHYGRLLIYNLRNRIFESKQQ